jgi:hypothetical protein
LPEKTIKSRYKKLGYRRGYWESGEILVHEYEEGTLILDFVNAKSKKNDLIIIKTKCRPASTLCI